MGPRQAPTPRTACRLASGSFQRFFDDILVCASTGVPEKLLLALEPWPLQKVIPFTQQALSGYLARTYDVAIDGGLAAAKERMSTAISEQVRREIGGDEQRVTAVHTMHFALTFKHLLLPVWLLTYRYGDKPFQLAVNAATGEVQGERPWSAIKIILTILFVLAAIALLLVLASGGEPQPTG